MAKLNVSDPNFQSAIASGFSQAQFITWVKDNFSKCGFPTPVETVGNDPKIIAYNLDFSS